MLSVWNSTHQEQITTITDTNNAKTILTTSNALITLVTSREHGMCGVFLTTTGIYSTRHTVLILDNSILKNNKHYTNVKRSKLSKYALITVLVNKGRPKDYVCNGAEMHLVKITGWECQGFWYWHTEPKGTIHSFCCLPYDRSISFQSQSSTGHNQVLPLAISGIHTSSSSYLRLLLCLPVTSLLIPISPSVTCFRRQFLRKIWPIQLTFLLFVLCRKFLSSLTACGRHSDAETCRSWYLNCILWFAFYCISVSAFVGWYSEHTKKHGMCNIKNKAIVVCHYKTGFWCRYFYCPNLSPVRKAQESPCTNSIKNVCVYVHYHLFRIAKLGNRNPQLRNNSCILIFSLLLIYLPFFHGATAPSRPGPPHYRGFTITLRHTTLGRTPWTTDRPIAETSTWQQTTQKKHTSMPQAGFEPTIPAGERPQIRALDRAATVIGNLFS